MIINQLKKNDPYRLRTTIIQRKKCPDLVGILQAEEQRQRQTQNLNDIIHTG